MFCVCSSRHLFAKSLHQLMKSETSMSLFVSIQLGNLPHFWKCNMAAMPARPKIANPLGHTGEKLLKDIWCHGHRWLCKRAGPLGGARISFPPPDTQRGPKDRAKMRGKQASEFYYVYCEDRAEDTMRAKCVQSSSILYTARPEGLSWGYEWSNCEHPSPIIYYNSGGPSWAIPKSSEISRFT